MPQVEREAQGLKRTTETLEGRTAALSQQLAQQRAEADQRLFAAQQDTDQVRARRSGPRMACAAGLACARSLRFMCLKISTACLEVDVTLGIAAQARRELEEAQAGRADAAEAATKLQRLVAAVQAEMADAQAAADQCAPAGLYGFTLVHASLVCKSQAIIGHWVVAAHIKQASDTFWKQAYDAKPAQGARDAGRGARGARGGGGRCRAPAL